MAYNLKATFKPGLGPGIGRALVEGVSNAPPKAPGTPKGASGLEFAAPDTPTRVQQLDIPGGNVRIPPGPDKNKARKAKRKSLILQGLTKAL